MPDWSDDDDEPVGVESNVLLGVPDGLVDDPTDITDTAVSRIGGHPVRPSPTYMYFNILIYPKQRLFFLLVNHPLNLLSARSALFRCSSSSKSGAPSRTAPGTEHFMCGAVHAAAVKRKTEGMY
jgi:pre-rRNA-processing protein TSR4